MAARALWTEERRVLEALKRMERPQGAAVRGFWTAEKRAAQSVRMRSARRGDTDYSLGDIFREGEALLREADAAKERLRKLGGLP